jgi:alkylation response protein AidB-like acyl-CoA dehydrogenase
MIMSRRPYSDAMAHDLLSRARDLRRQLDANGAKAEAANSAISDESVALMQEAGLYGAMIPEAAGGSELSISELLDLFAEVSYADGSTGWCLMANTAAASYFAAWCPDSFVDEAFGGDRTPIVAGQFAPNGTAVPVDGGYEIAGDFSFGSGIAHADWVGTGSFTVPPEGEDAEYRLALVPVDEAQVKGNWDVLGLRSTWSLDYRVDSTVPADRTFEFFAPTRYRGGPMYDLGVICLTEVGHAGWAFGVVRRALEEVTTLARGHQRMTGKSTLGDDPRFQYELGVLESRFRAAETWTRAAFERCERSAIDGAPDEKAILEARQATAFVTQEGTRIIEALYNNAGTAALRDGPIQRCFRDIHAGSQHAMVSPMQTYDFVGDVLASAAEDPLDVEL